MLDLFGSRFDTPTPLLVVEVGPSDCTRVFFAKRPNTRYLSVDRYKHADVKCDITEIALASESVDAVLCCHVLEHVDEFQRGISELFRILKPGGGGIIAVPQAAGLSTSRATGHSTFAGYGHVWEFGDDFPKLLRSAGFDVETIICNSQQAGWQPYHIVSRPGSMVLGKLTNLSSDKLSHRITE